MIEPTRHDLDAAIDRVAEQMVTAPGSDDLLQRVMAQLPERTATPWFLSMRVQATAAAALVLMAFVYARPSREVTHPEPSPIAARASVPDSQPREMARQPVATVARVSRSPIPDPRSPIDRPDHERSLPPVGAIESLELTDITAPAMALDAPAPLEPLVLTDLALDTKGDQ